jgi:hypothetical protein
MFSFVSQGFGRRWRRSMRQEMTDNEAVWEKITVAPYDCDLEVAVIEGDHVHPLVFACRRTPDGWIKVSTRERVAVSPTHWRRWRAKD